MTAESFRAQIAAEMSYCDVHRAVLQVMMHRGAMEEDEALRTVQSLATKLPGLEQAETPSDSRALAYALTRSLLPPLSPRWPPQSRRVLPCERVECRGAAVGR